MADETHLTGVDKPAFIYQSCVSRQGGESSVTHEGRSYQVNLMLHGCPQGADESITTSANQP